MSSQPIPKKQKVFQYLTVMATQGIEVSQAIEYTVNAAIFANFAVSGIALTASGYNIFEKVANGERPTPLELFQFSTSLLFFTNAAVNLQTAERLIQQVFLHFHQLKSIPTCLDNTREN